MSHEDLVRELVTELELQGIPKEIRDRCIHIIDVVIQAKQERMGATA